MFTCTSLVLRPPNISIKSYNNLKNVVNKLTNWGKKFNIKLQQIRFFIDDFFIGKILPDPIFDTEESFNRLTC